MTVRFVENVYTDLTKAVIAQMESPIRMVWDGKQWYDENYFFGTMRDITNHGANAGFHGFIYNYETCVFYDANQELIWEAICDDAEAFGQTPMQIIAGFNTYINSEMSLKNVLAWYALERAANEVTNAMEETN